MLYIILLVQVFSAYYAFAKEIKYKFTMSQDVAKYILTNNLNKTHVMIGYIDYATQTIAAHTKTKMYFPQIGHYNYYREPFNKLRKPEITTAELIEACTNFTEKQNKSVLLVLNFPVNDNNQQLITNTMLSANTSMSLLQQFTGKIIQQDEQFYLYECKLKK